MNFKIIAHRGLIDGPDKYRENNPKNIDQAIYAGFDVETDLWVYSDELFLGHNEPVYNIKKEYLSKKMWIHCKNLEAVEYMSNTDLNWFWHDKDKMTLTSWGTPWCYPYVYVNKGITVEKGKPHQITKNILGVCTDYPLEWKTFMEKI